ncbi:MAG: CehA/McbA family metallohydrolase [Victivallales bacterium]
MDKLFWDDAGNWYKGNLHTHTDHSDGALSVKETVAQYQKNGYDFMAITDHNILTDTSGYGNNDFLLFHGEEIGCCPSVFGGEYHIVGINIKNSIDPAKYYSPQQVIDAIRAAGGEAIIAHPFWSGHAYNELSALHDYLGIEVFNSSCFYSVGKGISDIIWDDLLIRRRHAFGFANDDCHNHFNAHRPNDACVAWNMVKAKSLTPEAIINAIKAGHFYSSWGPEIKSFYIKDGTVHVETSPVRVISVIASSGRGCGEVFTAENTISSADYKLKGPEIYIRVEVLDEKNRKAWSNPIYI